MENTEDTEIKETIRNSTLTGITNITNYFENHCPVCSSEWEIQVSSDEDNSTNNPVNEFIINKPVTNICKNGHYWICKENSIITNNRK